MPYQIIEEKNGIRCEFTGDFSDEMLRANREICEHPRFDQIHYQLIDVQKAENFSISSDTIAKIAAMDVNNFDRNPNMRIAVLATQKVMVGLTRMYQIHVELVDDSATWETKVFQSEDEARAWLSGPAASA